MSQRHLTHLEASRRLNRKGNSDNRKLRERDKLLLYGFAAYLNKRCDLNVANMVRPFMEKDDD